MPQQAVFIACLAHSGSTVLDIILGGHPNMVGLGEMASLLDPSKPQYLSQTHQTQCSCGQMLDDCPFWGPVCDRLKRDTDTSIKNRYRIVVESFDEFFGPDKILVDSSKLERYLSVLRQVHTGELRVVYIIRDVRSWVISMRKAETRHEEYYLKDLVRKFGTRAWRRLLRRTWPGLFCLWHRGNRKMRASLDELKLPIFQHGYEELTLYPDLIIPKICEFLGVEPAESMAALRDSGSHCALGNRMRLQEEKRQRIRYDNRWFWSGKWLLPSVLFPNIMRFNSREVYRNTHEAVWNK